MPNKDPPAAPFHLLKSPRLLFIGYRKEVGKGGGLFFDNLGLKLDSATQAASLMGPAEGVGWESLRGPEAPGVCLPRVGAQGKGTALTALTAPLLHLS